uniref:SLX4 interacting protein n=1 Tax=Neogobius melanostomus TaxID=47308 RepID=A0A8C6SX05_9GOBI
MAPQKYVIKCGNFAVLVDLHVLPRGDRAADSSWFTADQVEEVTALVQEAVDQRVKQYTESLHNRRLPRHKKDLPPASAFHVNGNGFNLAANFLKRHSNLRCIDLRVFPERFVVCVRCPEDASAALRGNSSWAAKELSEQSRSEYFSKAAETQEPPHIPTKTKKTGLQKIAKQASVQKEQQKDPKNTRGRTGQESAQLDHLVVPAVHTEKILDQGPTREQNNRNTDKQTSTNGASCQLETSPETSKTTRDEGEDPIPQQAKRACLESSTQTSRRDPDVKEESKAQSKAFPASERVETSVEVEPLTPGKQAPRLPLASTNNTVQTNQNRPAASLRGLSVKPASSSSSITSRSTQKQQRAEEEGARMCPGHRDYGESRGPERGEKRL